MADEPLAADSSVSYTVKELFDAVRGDLRDISGKLDGKVDRSEFVAWTTRADAEFDDNDRRIGILETADARRGGVRDWQARTWVAVGSLGAFAAAAAAAIGIALGGH